MPGVQVDPSTVVSDEFFTPTFLFFLLNLVVAFIAISAWLSRSTSTAAAAATNGETYEHGSHQQRGGGEEHRPYSNNNPSYYDHELSTEPPYRFHSFDHRSSMPDLPEEEEEEEEEEVETNHRNEQETIVDDTEAHDEESYEVIYKNIKAEEAREEAQRNRSYRREEGLTRPPPPPLRMIRRSWSMRPTRDFGRRRRGDEVSRGGETETSEDESVEEVERRRPGTARAWRPREEEADEGEGVDARADDFIRRFKEQLMLQRVESFSRYRAMIGRGK